MNMCAPSFCAVVLTVLLAAGCAAGPPPAPPPLVQQTGDAQAAAAHSFALRCAAPEVVRCVSFDRPEDAPDLGARAKGANQGRGGMGRRENHPGGRQPELDCTVAVAGCALRFTVPPRSGPGASGAWFANFSDDFSLRFGEGEEFYVQWRQRFSRAFLDTAFQSDGWKQIIVGEGDRPGYAPDGKVIWSCSQLEVVVQNNYMRGYPQMYHSCGGKDGRYENLPLYSAIDYRADQWMTFQLRIKIGTWYRNDRNYHHDSAIELWVAAEGETSRRAVWLDDYDLANTKPGAKYGKLWLLPYQSKKNSDQDHPLAETWYDELIISRAPIPDP